MEVYCTRLRGLEDKLALEKAIACDGMGGSCKDERPFEPISRIYSTQSSEGDSVKRWASSNAQHGRCNQQLYHLNITLSIA